MKRRGKSSPEHHRHIPILTHSLRSYTLLQAQQARVSALQAELKSLQTSLATSTTSEQAACEALAKDECFDLCNRVMTQLPRELRDMVYSHLSTKPHQRIDREYFRSSMDPVTRLHTYGPIRWKSTYHPEHFWTKAYVGELFFQELADNYYRTSTFIFGDDGGLIQRFLENDQLQLGYLPSDLVAKIEVHLDAMSYDQGSFRGYMFGATTRPDRLQAALKGVEKLKYGASVQVRFSTKAKDEAQRKEQVSTAVTALVPSLADARGKGYKAGLTIDGESAVELDVGTGDHRLTTVSKAEGKAEFKTEPAVVVVSAGLEVF